MNGRSLECLKRELEELFGELLADLPRRDQRHWAGVYPRGLLMDGDRKSIEPMARRLKEVDGSEQDYEQSPQQMVNQGTWPADLVRDRLQRWVATVGWRPGRRHRRGGAGAGPPKRSSDS